MTDWWPSVEEYAPGIDKQKWLGMLGNPKIFDPDSIAIMKRMLDFGGAATCKQLSQKYGESAAFYNFGSVRLARRILKETNCGVLLDDKNENSKLWPILYQGKYADEQTEGVYVWRLRQELRDALGEIDLSDIPLYVQEDDEDGDGEEGEDDESEDNGSVDGEHTAEADQLDEQDEQSVRKKQYWVWSPIAKRLWDEFFFPNGCLCLDVPSIFDDLNNYERFDDINDVPALCDANELWNFAHEMAVGDIIFAGRAYRYILGRGVIESEYIFDNDKKEHKHIRKVKWTHVGKWKHDGYMSMKLTDITPRQEYVEQLETLVSNASNYQWQDDQRSTISGEKRYWLFHAPGSRGERAWTKLVDEGIMCLYGRDHEDDFTKYDSKESAILKFSRYLFYNAESAWDFVHEVVIGDIIVVRYFGGNILGIGEIQSNYIFDEKLDENRHSRKVKWTHRGNWKHSGTMAHYGLIKPITEQDEIAQIEALMLGDAALALPEISEQPKILPMSREPYFEADFLSEVFMDPRRYATLRKLLERKKNVILKGAPGVGKTFAAKRLAFSIMGERDEGRVKVVQFHQSYSYEDFVMGYRPSDSGFHLVEGPFRQFCETATGDADRPYFFIIDEINRGNLSKIFGELMMLIEGDKRGQSVGLMYMPAKQFSVPANLYIIGMMNTADRSLAMMDYALRRRFAFFDMEPAFRSQGFKEYQSSKESAKLDSLIAKVESLNNAIGEDKSLGNGFRIGHSYFCTDGLVDDEWLESVVEFELIPLLEEYWFDDPTKLERWSDQLRGAANV